MAEYPFFPERTTVSLDGIWDFTFFENTPLEACQPENAAFSSLMHVPGAFDCMPEFYCKRGTAVYRRFIFLAEAMQFPEWSGGFGLRGAVWIDGVKVGEAALPYSNLSFPCQTLTAGRHEIRVAVDNLFDPEQMKLFLPFYDFYAFGGIYREMRLSSLPHSSIDRVQVRTVSYQTGEVDLQLIGKELPANLMIEFRFDTEKEFHRLSLTPEQGRVRWRALVPDFRLWCPEKPELHTVEVSIGSDRIVESFGIRSVEAHDKAVWINGKKLFLKGFNRHESSPLDGAGSSLALMVEDIEHLRQLNCNFVRGCHYSQDPRFLELCDRAGLLVWEECLGWGNSAASLEDPEFMRLQEEQARLMVRSSINHPSVIFWAFLNEFDSGCDAGYALASRLVKAIKEEDDSRLVTFACNHTTDDRCHELVDIVAYNTYPGWISDDYKSDPYEAVVPDRDRIIRYFRERIGDDKPIMVSEMGCCGLYGQHDQANAQWTEEFQAGYLQSVIEAVTSSIDLCGLTIWQMNDAKSYLLCGANIRTKPLALNLAGVFDQYRRPKLAAALVREKFQNR